MLCIKTGRVGAPTERAKRREQRAMNVSADGGQVLFTGLLHSVRNETERYAKVAARTKSAGDTCTKNNVIASERKRRVAILFILCCA